LVSNFYRLKLLNAILYFAHNTKRLNLTKLLKLLYFLDFTHFRQTGYPSLNLLYYSWNRGPVPKDFYEEIKGNRVPDDFSGEFAIIPSERWERTHTERKESLFKAISKPDLGVFTPRELEIMQNLSDIYRDAAAKDMSEITHLPQTPYDVTIRTKGLYKYIDYLLCVDNPSPEKLGEISEKLEAHFEILENFDLRPCGGK